MQTTIICSRSCSNCSILVKKRTIVVVVVVVVVSDQVYRRH